MIDRSPTGTGCSARMAVLHARGRMQVGDRYRARSIIGSEFTCGIDSETSVGETIEIVPTARINAGLPVPIPFGHGHQGNSRTLGVFRKTQAAFRGAATSPGPRQPFGAVDATRRPAPWPPWPHHWISSRRGPGQRTSPPRATAGGAIAIDAAMPGQARPPAAMGPLCFIINKTWRSA